MRSPSMPNAELIAPISTNGFDKKLQEYTKIAMNTLDHAAMMVQQAGVETTVDISETDEEVVYVIKMKK